jgi:hypothetical protein
VHANVETEPGWCTCIALSDRKRVIDRWGLVVDESEAAIMQQDTSPAKMLCWPRSANSTGLINRQWVPMRDFRKPRVRLPRYFIRRVCLITHRNFSDICTG